MFWRRRKQIEFASTKKVDRYPELLDDFVVRVLDQPNGAFVSDESSLCHFHEESSNDAMFARIKAVYGVDVSALKSDDIATILEQIAASRSHPVD